MSMVEQLLNSIVRNVPDEYIFSVLLHSYAASIYKNKKKFSSPNNFY